MRTVDAIDLNLVRVFDAVIRCRSVSRAGRMLGVTASAVSHSLSRLRRALGDELFVSTEEGMLPTPRALDIYPQLRDGLDRIAAALGPLDSTPVRATFRLATSDYGASVVLPLVLDTLNPDAGGQSLEIVHADSVKATQLVENGDVHAALGSFEILSNRLRRNLVHADELVVAVKDSHALVATRERSRALVTIAQSVMDAMVKSRDDGGEIAPPNASEHPILFDPAHCLAPRQDHRTLLSAARSVPFPSTIVQILQDADLAAILPRRFVESVTDRVQARLATFALSRPLPLELVWRHGCDQEGSLTWLLTEIARRRGRAQGQPA